MLPGVEFARRRRLHHNGSSRVATPNTSLCDRNRFEGNWMEESVLLARKRLDGKLNGSFTPSKNLRNGPSSADQTSDPKNEVHQGSSNAEDNQNKTKKKQMRAECRRRSDRRDSESKEICAVCLDELRSPQNLTILPCLHKYHSDCVVPWLLSSSCCPSCRKVVVS